jgi:ligand-binding sensor domain-containing protein
VALRSAAISLLALVSLAASAHSQRLPAKAFTTADGLANNAVKRIVSDSHGYLWFCTREGLSRFDGHGFTTYGIDDGLPSAVIYDLVEPRQRS